MDRFRRFFKGGEDPRTSNATRHDFLEMLMIALLSSLCSGQTCVDMADFAAINEGFLRRFMRLEHGTPGHDSFSRLFRKMEPGPLAALIIGKDRHYVLALKVNQGTLHKDVRI